MAIPKGIQRLLIGTSVKLKSPIHWHGLHIPKGSIGVITRVEGKGTAAKVRFNDKKYGSFECWIRELGPA